LLLDVGVVVIFGFINPTIAYHADSLGLSLAVEFGALLEILLAALSLRVAEPCFG